MRRLAHDQGRREGSGLPHAAIQNASSGWHCAGQLASAGSKFQCECDLPLLDDPVLNSKSGATVETTWRGFSIAPTGKWPAIAGELSFDFSNVGTQGKASISAGNVTVTGNATMFRTNGPNSKLCPTNELLFEHEGGGNLSCSYAMNYQAGGASSYMAIGCNINSSMPTLVDHKNYDMVRAPAPCPDPLYPPRARFGLSNPSPECRPRQTWCSGSAATRGTATSRRPRPRRTRRSSKRSSGCGPLSSRCFGSRRGAAAACSTRTRAPPTHRATRAPRPGSAASSATATSSSTAR